MSRVEAPVDVEVLRTEIRRTCTDVSDHHDQEFIFPTSGH
jgi:sRNA-binding carbon storage regulator CsrA